MVSHNHLTTFILCVKITNLRKYNYTHVWLTVISAHESLNERVYETSAGMSTQKLMCFVIVQLLWISIRNYMRNDVNIDDTVVRVLQEMTLEHNIKVNKRDYSQIKSLL